MTRTRPDEQQSAPVESVLTENDIVEAVAQHLRGTGYRVDSTCSTDEQGIDIEAVNLSSQKRLLIEAKGGTSSKATTRRYGRPFTLGQAKSHVSVAFYYAAKLINLYGQGAAQIALAFPDDENHCKLVAAIGSVLERLSIGVFLVDELRQVRVWKVG